MKYDPPNLKYQLSGYFFRDFEGNKKDSKYFGLLLRHLENLTKYPAFWLSLFKNAGNMAESDYFWAALPAAG